MTEIIMNTTRGKKDTNPKTLPDQGAVSANNISRSTLAGGPLHLVNLPAKDWAKIANTTPVNKDLRNCSSTVWIELKASNRQNCMRC